MLLRILYKNLEKKMDKENYSYKKIEFYAIFCFYEQD